MSTTLGGRVALGALIGAAVTGALLALPDHAHADSVPACGNGSLSVVASPVQSADTHRRIAVLFRNESSTACSLRGYPGLDAVGGYGVIKSAVRTPSGYMGGPGEVSTVVIPPHHYASAIAEWLAVHPRTGQSCGWSSGIDVTPPNTTDTHELAAEVGICQLQIHPTVSGPSGFGHFAAARQQWVIGGSAVSAEQGRYWHRAARALRQDGTEYGTQVAQLRQLISLPDADQTPQQNREWRHDTRALDGFFGTPGLYR